MEWIYAFLALGTALGVPIAALAVATGQGKAAASAFESIARQPGATGDIRGALIITLALIESIAIYALLVFFMLQGKVPAIEKAVEALAKK